MSQGSYSVVRCIPDPARGEMFNIGLAIWTKGRFLVRVDEWAAKRAAAENPDFAPGALINLEGAIHAQLQVLDPINNTKFKKMLKNQRGFPFFFAEPQFVNVPQVGTDSLMVALEKMMARMVSPRGEEELANTLADPVEQIATRVLGLIANNTIRTRYQIIGKQTGHERRVDFFAGAPAKVALDVLKLDTKSEEAAMRKADLEAFKIFDLKDSEVSEFYVFTYRQDEERGQERLIDDQATRAIKSVGGKVVSSVAEAEQVLRQAA